MVISYYVERRRAWFAYCPDFFLLVSGDTKEEVEDCMKHVLDVHMDIYLERVDKGYVWC